MAISALNRAVQDLDGTRYMNLAGFTIIAYDALITLQEEFDFVWSSSSHALGTMTRIAYSVNRYGTLAMTALFVAVLFPNRLFDISTCLGLLSSVMSMYVITCACGNGLILHALVRIWECPKRVAWLLATGFVILHATVLAFAVLSIKQVFEYLQFEDNTNVCSLQRTPFSVLGAFVPAAVLDGYAFLLLFLNALSRPRSASQRLLDMLLKDGLVYFLVCFGTKVLSIITISAAPTALIFLSLGFGFDMNAMAAARLYLRICEKDYRALQTSKCFSIVVEEDCSSFPSFTDSTSDSSNMEIETID
ncbi:hypothetical protein SCHPADRAFT_1003346 [Schizopora paradoxa]|uniref:DUF6533 domain-containing protein n=1 Tax=Schizopora paradoxa TaxID=27342 RepID=A0A0H2RHC8_9AGAM|nr:hypothetical protein SCHPADRAFT_1003346 [Schizopora paradoxa]